MVELKKLTITCPNCGGAGVIFVNDSEHECLRCKGEGVVEMEG